MGESVNRETGDERRETGDERRETGDGRRETGEERREKRDGRRETRNGRGKTLDERETPNLEPRTPNPDPRFPMSDFRSPSVGNEPLVSSLDYDHDYELRLRARNPISEVRFPTSHHRDTKGTKDHFFLLSGKSVLIFLPFSQVSVRDSEPSIHHSGNWPSGTPSV